MNTTGAARARTARLELVGALAQVDTDTLIAGLAQAADRLPAAWIIDELSARLPAVAAAVAAWCADLADDRTQTQVVLDVCRDRL